MRFSVDTTFVIVLDPDSPSQRYYAGRRGGRVCRSFTIAKSRLLLEYQLFEHRLFLDALGLTYVVRKVTLVDL